MLKLPSIPHVMLRRSAGDETAAKSFDLLASPLIDRVPPTLEEGATLGAAIDLLLDGAPWGVPVVARDRRYRGMCTPRCVANLCLLINGETAALLPSLGFMRDDIGRIRQRLASALATPVAQVLDPFVPVLRTSSSLSEAFFQLYRNNPIVPVVDGSEERRLVGVITCDRAIRVALDRPELAKG
jgi:CBS domain-containing protein